MADPTCLLLFDNMPSTLPSLFLLPLPHRIETTPCNVKQRHGSVPLGCAFDVSGDSSPFLGLFHTSHTIFTAASPPEPRNHFYPWFIRLYADQCNCQFPAIQGLEALLLLGWVVHSCNTLLYWAYFSYPHSCWKLACSRWLTYYLSC